MKVAILIRVCDPFSLRNYRENVVRELKGLGVTGPFFRRRATTKVSRLVLGPAGCLIRNS